MGLFDNAVEVIINNKIVQSIKTLNGGVLYEKGNGTFLTIDVPLNIVYSDAFNITGTLKDSNRTGLVGETVKLKVGSTVVDSTTTTTGGAYSFTQTPVATGNHSFQVIYEGSSTYNASESTIVNRVVGKETTVLSVTSPVDNYLTYNANIQFAGTLTDDDGTVLADKTIKIKEGNNTVNSTTTDSNGAFSMGLYSVSVGTHNFSIIYEGDSNYTASSVSRTVIVREHNYAMSVSSTKDILSYSDSDSCTVTAVLTDNSVFVEGETLSYTVKHGSTTIDSGSAVTDANGSISFNYTATAIGYIDIEITYGSLSNTYDLIDAKYYASNSRIDSEIINYSSTQHIFASTYEVKVGDEIHFRFKSQLPYRTVIGIGSTQGSDLTVEKVGSSYKLWRNVLNNVSNLNSRYAFTTTECDYVLKRVDESNQHRIWFFNECTSTLFDYYQCGTSIRKIRIDKFVGDYFEVEVFVL